MDNVFLIFPAILTVISAKLELIKNQMTLNASNVKQTAQVVQETFVMNVLTVIIAKMEIV